MDITRSIVSERERGLLSNEDYAAYHAQTTRRVRKLRKRLGIATPKNKKYAPKAAVTAENVVDNVEWVQLLLASAERCWSDAMAMKQAQSPENTQKKDMSNSTKTQIATKLHKAILFADNLAQVLTDLKLTKSSTTDLLEAKAYLYTLKGTRAFEKKQWQSCMECYAITYLIYSILASTSKTDLYKDQVSTIVEPSLRHAAHQLGQPRTKPSHDIAIQNFSTTESDARKALLELDPDAFKPQQERSRAPDGTSDAPTQITWRSKKVNLEDATISQALGLAQQHEKTLQEQYTSYTNGKTDAKALAAAYDDIITARQDAADATKAAIDDLTRDGVDQSDFRIQSLQVTRTAVNYAVIEYRIGRFRVLCGPDDGLKFEPSQRKPHPKAKQNGTVLKSKPEPIGRRIARLRERVALYDSILQSLDSIKELPGVVKDESFTSELAGQRSYFRALRCLAIGRSHAMNGKTTEALALYHRAHAVVKEAQSTLSNQPSTDTAPKLSISPASLSAAIEHLSRLELHTHALADLKHHMQPSPQTTNQTPAFKRPLIETLHLNQYHENVDLTNLVNYPAKLQPIPVKPLFFDIAYNYIQYPGHGKQSPATINGDGSRPGTPSQDGTAEKPAPAKRGLFGLFARS